MSSSRSCWDFSGNLLLPHPPQSGRELPWRLARRQDTAGSTEEKRKMTEVVVGVWIVGKRSESLSRPRPYRTSVCGENRPASHICGQWHPSPIPLSPHPVDNRRVYPRRPPRYPRVRTPGCPHCAQLIPSDRKVIHNSTEKPGR